MSTKGKDIKGEETVPPSKETHLWRRIAEPVGISLVSLVVFIMIAIAGLTLWLTPDRLTALINREASENLDADVEVRNARFTLWSSFPHFAIEIDSIYVKSRSLKGLPQSVLDSLPGDASYLASTSRLRGSINVLKLLYGDISLKNVEVEDADVNLVAATDSIANYNIFPTSTTIGTIPHFSADKVILKNPRNLRFFSRVTDSDIKVDLSKASLVKTPHKSDTYRLMLEGRLNAKVNRLTLLDNFSFGLGGDIAFKFDPFSIKVSNYNVALGNTKGKLNLDLQVGDEMKINDFSYNLGSFNLMGLLASLPPDLIPVMNSVQADIQVNASARLTTPYKFSATELPSLILNFNVEDGDINYKFNNNRNLSVRHIGLGGKLVFDGANRNNSYIEVPTFSLQGEGTDLEIGARVSYIFTTPVVNLALSGKSDAAVMGKMFNGMVPMQMSGSVISKLQASFNVPDIQQIEIGDVRLDGDIKVNNFTFSYPKAALNTSGSTLALEVGGKASMCSASGVKDCDLQVTVTGDNIGITANGVSTRISGLKIQSGTLQKVKNSTLDKIPLNLDLATAKIKVSNRGESTNVDLSGIEAHGSAEINPMNGALSKLNFNLGGEEVKGKLDSASLSLKNAAVALTAHKFGKPIKIETYTQPAKWSVDKVSMDMTSHTSPFLQVNLPEAVRQAIASWDAHLDVKVGEGMVLTPDFPVRNSFKALHAEASPDSVVLHKLKLKSQSSELSLAAKVSNLRQFLGSTSVAPLYLSVNAALDTVQINQLAGAYEYGRKIKGKPVAVSHKEDTASYSASDTTALLIPRNLIADINATAKMTRYTNLKLYNLATKLKIADGVASADHLDISSDFGNIGLGFELNTANLQRMGLTLNGGIKDVNLVSFFKNFHALLIMMPQMKNLDGVLSADVNARMDYFPNMFVNIPSVNANLGLKGRKLIVHQDKFIHKIAEMLLIRNSDDIHIANMDVRAHVGSNLVELFPFEFQFENYRLKMAGVNNFDGDMYYHIGVDRSMVPFPFGINIEGNFSDPKIRFGGVDFKESNASAITRNIMENHQVNMVKIARKYLGTFIHKAAQSDNTPKTEYVY